MWPELVGRLDVDAADRVAAGRRAVQRAYRLTLDDALALGAVTSRDYLRQRENVYLAALALTGAPNEFNPLFGSRRRRRAARRDGTNAVGIGGSTARGATDRSVSRAFETGGGFVLGLAQDFLEEHLHVRIRSPSPARSCPPTSSCRWRAAPGGSRART